MGDIIRRKRIPLRDISSHGWESPFSGYVKAEHVAHRPGNHEFFVRVNDADRDSTGLRGNHAFIRRIALFFDFNAKESQPVANPGTDDRCVLRDAARGCAAYQLSWFDAHLWAYAEHYGLPEILTEDFQHDRLYGTVRAVNPFIDLR